MDRKLLAWGLRPFREGGATTSAATSVDVRVAGPNPAMTLEGLAPRTRTCLPRLWLFTDSLRLPDPLGAVGRLPRGRAGVVFRHDSDPGRSALGREIARICRDRRLVLVVAGDSRLAAALRAGVHWRGGRRPGPVRPCGVITSSAHSVAEIRRAAGAGAALIFLSPAFPTASHAGAPALGPLRWAALARRAGVITRMAALGGVDGRSILRLSRCFAAGAIGALS